MFNKCDTDGNGSIDSDELLTVLLELRQPATKETAEELMTKYGGAGACELLLLGCVVHTLRVHIIVFRRAGANLYIRVRADIIDHARINM